MKILDQEQSDALLAFHTAFELHVTGVWPAIEEAMREEFGIEDPESALEGALAALRGE